MTENCTSETTTVCAACGASVDKNTDRLFCPECTAPLVVVENVAITVTSLPVFTLTMGE